MTRNILPAAIAFFLFGQAAADSIEDSLAACTAMTDEAARLSCFDGAAGALKPPVVVAEPPAAEPVATSEPEPEPEPEPAPPPPPEPAEAPADPLALFGMNPELASQQETAQAELKEIKAVAVEVTKRTRGEHVVTLDNGQVWTEKEAESYFRVKVGDTVTIKRISMGGFRMVGRGNRASAVRRLK